MHMADALLSPAVGMTMNVVSTAAVAYSVAKIKQDDLSEKKVPVMGVMGAFVFAAQMINFTIPMTGSSGHIGGGILLAAMLGGFPALVTISVVLIIQCLFFADGGLLALGCNIFNMGVIPCLVTYPLLFKPLVKKGLTQGRIALASVAAVVAGLQLGAFGVVLQTQLSGITALPLGTFLLLMQPIHLAIGLAEGVVTAAILGFVYQMRPEILESTLEGGVIKSGIPMRGVLAALVVLALITGSALSLFASAYPDGLEWSVEKTAGTAELEAGGGVFDGAASIQAATAFMPDYAYKDAGEEGAGTSVAGIAGGLMTFIMAFSAAFVISLVKKRKRGSAAAAA